MRVPGQRRRDLPPALARVIAGHVAAGIGPGDPVAALAMIGLLTLDASGQDPATMAILEHGEELAEQRQALEARAGLN